MNARPLVAAAALTAALSPLAASAGIDGSISVGAAYSFNLQSVDEAFVNPAFQYDNVDGYFVGFESLTFAGFTAATGLSIDRLESVQLRFEGTTSSVGSGGVFANQSATVPGGFLNLNDLDLFATERNAANGTGISVAGSAATGAVSEDHYVDLSSFAADTIDVGVFTNIAFYGSLGQVTGEGRGFFSSGFAVLDYTYSVEPAPSLAVSAVPTPSAALAGIFGLAGVALRRRKAQAPTAG